MGRELRLEVGLLELFVVGTSHALASASVRERLHVDLDEAYGAIRAVLAQGVLAEALPLATCARFELYGVAEDPDRASRLLVRMVASRVRVPQSDLEGSIFTLRGSAAVRHLFRVASGLDSVVHGEAQILGQVREAAHHPLSEATKGVILGRLFQMSLATGKRVRSETDIGRGAVSLAGAAVGMVGHEMGSLASASALVLGAGDTGSLVARLLRKAGVERLVVANRTEATARRVAEKLGGEGVSLEELPARLAEADLVVGAISGEERLVTPESLDRAISGQDRGPRAGHRRRYFLDLAHPRNFDPALEDRPDVRLFHLDHVFERVEAAKDGRARQVPRAEAIVNTQTDVFESWARSRENVVLLRAVRDRVLEVARSEADRLSRGEDEEERARTRKLARSIARTLLHAPTVELREVDPESSRGRSLLEAAPALFGLEPDSPVDAESV